MTKIQYLKTWAMRVVEKPWGIAGAVTTGLFFINPILTIFFPEVGPLPPDLAWQIPLTILLVFLGPRFFLVPYWMHQKLEKQVAETSTSSLSLKAIEIRRTYIAENGTPSGLHKVLLIIKNDSKLAKTIHGIKATVPGEKFGISSITGAYLKPEGFFTF